MSIEIAPELLEAARRKAEEIAASLPAGTPFILWDWRNAPPEFRAISMHVRGEQYVVLAAPGLEDEWVARLNPFVACVTLSESLGRVWFTASY